MSKSTLRILAATFSLLLFTGSSKAKEWRGIVPLASTREDVVRIFKQCSDVNPSCEFRLDNEYVHVEFSGASTTGLHGCSRLPPDTVLLVEVIPAKALDLKAIGVDKSRLREFGLNPPAPVEYRGFIDDQEGLVIKTYQRKVVQIDYIAKAKDRHLCRSYYENAESFVQETFSSHAPVMAINCPQQRPQAGERIGFSADIAGKPRISFLWKVSAGRIVEGQGTRSITVDTTGLQGRLITATVSLGRVAASCDVQIAP